MSNLAENIPQEPESQKEITIEKWIGKIGTDTDKDISSAKVKGKVKVFLQTKHFKKDDTITVIIIDAADNSELTTATAKVEANLNAKKAIMHATEEDKQVWKITTSTGEPKRRNQCVVDILEEVGTEYKVKPKGQSMEGWINKDWIIEVVKFKE